VAADDDVERLRLFTAISIPPGIKAQVDDIAERLKKGSQFTGAHPAWVATDNLHLTLVFLGSTPADKVESIRESMHETARVHVPFELHFSGVELFPNPRDPRVICVNIHGGLKRARGFPVETRPFRPHLTLARIKSARGTAGLRDLVKSHGRSRTDDFAVEAITLYQSRLSPKGSIYTVISESRLSML
jgi:RNA 2',3'-cyclic 3'-phosphodiesterase